MQHPKHHFFEFTPDTLAAWCAERSMPAFRSKQLIEWVYEKGIIDPARMSNLSARDREMLAREMTFLSGHVVARKEASDGTSKLLVQWDSCEDDAAPSSTAQTDGLALGPSTDDDTPRELRSGLSLPVITATPRLHEQADHSDGTYGVENECCADGSSIPANVGVRLDSSRQTECVMIPSESPSGPRRTACISSQVGCPVGCKFCASGIGGLEGNLSAGRIVEQVWRLRWQLADKPAPETKAVVEPPPRISNVVFMGMGEPLSNFSSVISAIRTICAPWGLGIGARKVTISTVGLPQAIDRLANELELPVTLALSLHAPNDAIRRELIPWANYTSIADLLSACHRWFQKTGREITLEYTLLREINDRPEHARELSTLARTLRANVNLIRYNEVAGMPFNRPNSDDVLRFQRVLQERGVNVHIRASRGRDIAAACGQLRHETGPKAAG